MKRISWGFILTLSAGMSISIVACGDSAPRGKSEDSHASHSDPSSSDSSPGWPPEPQTTVPIAPNLLALNYYVVLDGSGSMEADDCANGKSKSSVSKDALAVFAMAIPQAANLGLLAFDAQGRRERLELGPENRDQFVTEANRTNPGGGTPLRSAITLAYRALVAQGQKQLGYGEYHLVIVTDGMASDGEDPTAVVDEIVATSPVLIHTIGFCIGPDHSLNQPGRTIYKEANNPSELRAGLQSVLAEAPSFDVSDF